MNIKRFATTKAVEIFEKRWKETSDTRTCWRFRDHDTDSVDCLYKLLDVTTRLAEDGKYVKGVDQFGRRVLGNCHNNNPSLTIWDGEQITIVLARQRINADGTTSIDIL